MLDPEHAAPVFSEPTGRRWERVRAGAIVAGATSIFVILGLIAAALLPPLLPTNTAFERTPRRALPPISSRAAQEHDAARTRMYGALRRGQRDQVRQGKGLRPRGGPPATDSIMAGFYVDWDEHSYESLKAHLDRLDWVIAEWAFIAPVGDTIMVNADQRHILDTIGNVPEKNRPKVLLMVSNVLKNSGRFGGGTTTRLLLNPEFRQRAAKRIAQAVINRGLSGVTLDFENIPDEQLPQLSQFLSEVRAAIGPDRLLTMAVQDYLPPEWVKKFADQCDRLILMFYDEHYQKSDPGPVAGRGWYTEMTDSFLAMIPPAKAMMGIGAYGYDWSDPGRIDTLEAVTVPDVWQLARANHVLPVFDPDVSNPYLAWTSPDSVDHFIWYLDATTAADEIRIARQRGVTSVAVWKLGGEDPAMWRMFGRHGEMHSLDSLERIDPGYNVNFESELGEGELLRVKSRPYPGWRYITSDSTAAITSVTYDSVPGEWVVSRTGHQEHEVAITFDDGPDIRWTPSILDTLKSRNATATFFLIGMEVVSNYGLTNRIMKDSNEIGNHTFTHPNLANTKPWWTRVEIDATQRLFEAVLGHRTVLMRTPYLGDSDPSTPDELLPIAIATNLGYITAGLTVDGEDWHRGITPAEVLRNVLRGRDSTGGNVILLHDGGGTRTSTVAILGQLIDSLRARGDTVVSLGQLANLPRSVIMPTISGRSSFTRIVELMIFGGVSILLFFFHWAFFTAIVLAMSRLAIVLTLAAIHRFRRRRIELVYQPTVSVVVPAYREEAVIVATVRSLLAQRYQGSLEVIVVDDGSPDDTYGMAQRAFADEPRVRVLTKSNGGKSSALNFGIRQANGDIIVALDADTLFEADAVSHLVAPLSDPHVGAVAGNAKVGNRINLVTRWQALEYVTSQNLDRRAFALLDCIMVVPGAIGAWRKALVLEVGGFSTDTLAEDQDLTLSIGRRGYRVAYADDAIAWTEAPDTLRGLAKQRFRWSFGTLQCAWKHRDLLFRVRAGTLGLVALPNVWIFQLFFSLLAPVADFAFVFSLAGVLWTFHEHNNTYAIDSLSKIVLWYGIFITVDWLAVTLAFLMEPREDRRLTWLVFMQRFAYRQVLYWVVLRSMIAALRGGLVGWGKLDRKATVEVPV